MNTLPNAYFSTPLNRIWLTDYSEDIPFTNIKKRATY